MALTVTGTARESGIHYAVPSSILRCTVQRKLINLTILDKNSYHKLRMWWERSPGSGKSKDAEKPPTMKMLESFNNPDSVNFVAF